MDISKEENYEVLRDARPYSLVSRAPSSIKPFRFAIREHEAEFISEMCAAFNHASVLLQHEKAFISETQGHIE